MPFHPQHSLLRVEVPALHSIDTSSVENLFGMWSLFSKTANAMQDGRRLENLSWRLWNRETFCCNARSRTSSPSPAADSLPSCSFQSHSSTAAAATDDSVPALSSSLDSASSCDESEANFEASQIGEARPELHRSRSRGREKHITPDALASIVANIRNTQSLEPIQITIPTPPQPAPAASSSSLSQDLADLRLEPPAICLPAPTTPENNAQTSMTASQTAALESSASTFDINDDKTSQSVGSDNSSNTEMSTHSVVRGFIPGGAPSSYRSQTNLAAQPTPILKTSPKYSTSNSKPKKKGAMFTIGTSSGEDESSFEGRYRSSLSESLKARTSERSGQAAAFRDEPARAPEHSPVFETDEEDEEVSESAIEDDDDSSDWEDSEDQSRPSSVNEKEMFQRVDSRPDLTSRRSLITALMHEPDRARALANAASRSTPAMRRSRTTTPNGPSLATSPDQHQLQHQHHQLQQQQQLPPPASAAAPQNLHPSQTNLHHHNHPHHQHNHHHQPTGPQPILRSGSGSSQPIQLAYSPRTTRRNMLSTELTESLRKNLLWERQHRSTPNLAALMKRRHTSTDVKNLRQMPEPGPVFTSSHQPGGVEGAGGVGSGNGNGQRRFNNEYFDHGLQEYHVKGW